jgi:hypothetical protein
MPRDPVAEMGERVREEAPPKKYANVGGWHPRAAWPPGGVTRPMGDGAPRGAVAQSPIGILPARVLGPRNPLARPARVPQEETAVIGPRAPGEALAVIER